MRQGAKYSGAVSAWRFEKHGTLFFTVFYSKIEKDGKVKNKAFSQQYDADTLYVSVRPAPMAPRQICTAIYFSALGEFMAAFTDNDTRKLEMQVKASESYRLTAYHSKTGTLKVGYGHDCGPSSISGIFKVGDRITPEQAEGLFQKDLTSAVWSVRRSLPWVRTLSPARQAVLYELTFAMGLGESGTTGLLSLDDALREIETGNYASASQCLLASDWAKQTGSRASRLARQLKTGDWQ